MRVLDVVITAQHASIEREILSVLLFYAQPIEAAVVIDSQKYPYLVGFTSMLSYDRLKMLVFGWPCKIRNPKQNEKENFRHSPLEVGFVIFIPDVPRTLRWRIQIECTLSSAKPVFEAIVKRLQGLYEFEEINAAEEQGKQLAPIVGKEGKAKSKRGNYGPRAGSVTACVKALEELIKDRDLDFKQACSRAIAGDVRTCRNAAIEALKALSKPNQIKAVERLIELGEEGKITGLSKFKQDLQN